MALREMLPTGLTCWKSRRPTSETAQLADKLARNDASRTTVLVFGHLGMGNIGDEAMLPPILDCLAKSYPRALFRIVAGPRRNGGLRAPQHCQLEWVDRNMWVLAAALWKSNVFVLAGGTHLCAIAATWRHTLGVLRHLMIYLFARVLRVQVHFWGVGVGPLETRLGRLLARAAVHCAHFIRVRDAQSLHVLKQLGYPSHRTSLGDDPAVLLDLPSRRVRGPHLGLSILQYHAWYRGSPESDTRLVEACQRLLRQWFAAHPDGQASLICFYSADCLLDDRAIAERIVAGFCTERVQVVDPQGHLDACLETFCELSHAVTMRYHAEVLAWRFGIPQVVIAYHRKNYDYAESVNLPPDRIIGVRQFLGSSNDRLFAQFFCDADENGLQKRRSSA